MLSTQNFPFFQVAIFIPENENSLYGLKISHFMRVKMSKQHFLSALMSSATPTIETHLVKQSLQPQPGIQFNRDFTLGRSGHMKSYLLAFVVFYNIFCSFKQFIKSYNLWICCIFSVKFERPKLIIIYSLLGTKFIQITYHQI